jgi:hypothetical protein
MQRNQPALAKLGVPHLQQVAGVVDVGVVKADRLADPQAFSQGPQPVA